MNQHYFIDTEFKVISNILLHSSAPLISFQFLNLALLYKTAAVPISYESDTHLLDFEVLKSGLITL